MKFFHNRHYNNTLYFVDIINNKFDAIYQKSKFCVYFFKNGKFHNGKGPAKIYISLKIKDFYYNGEFFGSNFSKQTWRSSVKMLIFS